jgi:hypothetical protein
MVMHLGRHYLLAAVLSIALTAFAVPWASPASAQNAGSAVGLSPELASAMAQYHRALDEYNKARQSYAAASDAYWNLISEKRQLRNTKRARGEQLSITDYVLVQPPVYTGPPKPQNPLKLELPSRPAYVPLVADFCCRGAPGIQIHAAISAERERIQAYLCQNCARRRPDA